MKTAWQENNIPPSSNYLQLTSWISQGQGPQGQNSSIPNSSSSRYSSRRYKQKIKFQIAPLKIEIILILHRKVLTLGSIPLILGI